MILSLPLEIYYQILLFAEVHDLINLIQTCSIIHHVVSSFMDQKQTIAAAFVKFCQENSLPLIQLNSSKAKTITNYKKCKKYEGLIFCHHTDSSTPIIIDVSSSDYNRFKYAAHIQIKYYQREKTIVFFTASIFQPVYYEHRLSPTTKRSEKIENFCRKITAIQTKATFNVRFNCYQPKGYQFLFLLDRNYYFRIGPQFKYVKIPCGSVKILQTQQLTSECVRVVLIYCYLGVKSKIVDCLFDFAAETAIHLKHFESEFALYADSCLLLDGVLFCKVMKPIKIVETTIDEYHFDFSFVDIK